MRGELKSQETGGSGCSFPGEEWKCLRFTSSDDYGKARAYPLALLRDIASAGKIIKLISLWKRSPHDLLGGWTICPSYIHSSR